MFLYAQIVIIPIIQPVSPTLQDLLPPDQQPLTIHKHETVMEAIDRLKAHDYNQLPLVDENGIFTGEVITYDTILQAILSFDIKPSELRVKDAIKQVRSYSAEDDLLGTLDDIQRNDFALITDSSGKLTGIVTTADTTVFFREYAVDLMQIQGVEESLKEAIEILYGGLGTPEISDAIESISDRHADIRKKLPTAIKAYLAKVQVQLPQALDDKDALILAETKLNLPKSSKTFEKLSFDEFTQLLLRHPKAPKLDDSASSGALRTLLDRVRDTRNKLAHFRGDVSIAERNHIKFAAQWLERNQPIRSVDPPTGPTLPIENLKPDPSRIHTTISNLSAYENKDDEDTLPQGKYAKLAEHFASQQRHTQSCIMTFPDIEKILGEKLPESAYDYRAWWANDPSKPQASAWLAQGWKAQNLSMSEKRLSFVRTDDRQRAYISFFSRLNSTIANAEVFPHKNISPQGQNWHTLASLQTGGMQTADIIAAFVRQGRFRVELYLDDSHQDLNKFRFDSLLLKKAELEQQFGEPLEWERLEGKRASRIATYTHANILTDYENEEVIKWAARKAVDFHNVFNVEIQALAT